MDLLTTRGLTVAAAMTADSPGTVAALVRAGLGVGVLTEVAARVAEAAGALVTLPLPDGDLVRRVAAYWYDTLLGDEVGRILHREVLAAPPSPGVVPLVSGPAAGDRSPCRRAPALRPAEPAGAGPPRE